MCPGLNTLQSELTSSLFSNLLQAPAPPPLPKTFSMVPPSPPVLHSTNSPQRPRSLPPYSQNIPAADDTENKGTNLLGACLCRRCECASESQKPRAAQIANVAVDCVYEISFSSLLLLLSWLYCQLKSFFACPFRWVALRLLLPAMLVNDELLHRLTNGKANLNKPLVIQRSSETSIPLDYDSSPEEVGEWLRGKGFSEP